MNPRRGTVIILVAGITALIAALAYAFIVRMRADGEEMDQVRREAQARIMLIAGCEYVMEASRLGYDGLTAAQRAAVGPKHREAFGWVDVRDGARGPRGEDWFGPGGAGGPDGAFDRLYDDTLVEDSDGDGGADRPAWPALFGVARCPMHVLRQTPDAVALTVTPNPIEGGKPWLRNPDPQPLGADFAAWRAGDPRPRAGTAGRAWFRACRVEDDRFVVACGAGGTQGFRDWDEVRGLGATAEFGGDRALFDQALATETRLWYLIEWSPAIGTNELHNPHPIMWTSLPSLDQDGTGGPDDTGRVYDRDHFVAFPMNTSQSRDIDNGGTPMRTVPHSKNMVGTIRWVQRLQRPPTRW